MTRPLIDTTPLQLWASSETPQGSPASQTEPYGWDQAGNCVWCGEAGRCQCDHRDPTPPAPKPTQPPVKHCLKCNKSHRRPSQFCSAKCRTAWMASMNKWADRFAKTKIPGQDDLFIK